jgi:hypothetical protein
LLVHQGLRIHELMKKYYFFMAGLLLAVGLKTTTAYAQVDFRPGYIVQLAGDTVRGEVDYRDTRSNMTQCRFRPNSGASITTYQPAELRAYGLSSEHKLYQAIAPASSAPKYFLEVLVSGPAKLYFWRDDERADHYYVATEAFPLTELVQRKVLLEQQRVLQEQNIYRNTLAQALPGCPAAQAQLPALRFTARDLARTVLAYNQCFAPQPATPVAEVVTGQPKGSKVQFGIIAGAQSTTMRVKYDDQFSKDNTLEFGPKFTPVVGLSLNLPLTVLSRKLSLETELFYDGQHYDQTYTKTTYGGGVYSSASRYTFNMVYLRLPLLLRYTYPKGRVRPFLEAGPTLDYALKFRSEVVMSDPQGNPYPATEFFPNNVRHLQEGLAGGAGVQFDYLQGRHAALLVRYEADNGWTTGQGLDTWSNRFYGMVTFGLTK